MQRHTRRHSTLSTRGVSAALRQLASIRRRYGGDFAREKLALLRALAGVKRLAPGAVPRLHEHLLYLRAFPDNAEVLGEVTAQLGSFARRVRALPAADRRRLEDTALVGTTSRHSFDAPIIDWLVRRYPGHVDVDWPSVDSDAGIESLLRLTVLRAEEDGFDSGLGARAWLRRARGVTRHNDLEWLLAQVAGIAEARKLWPALWDRAALPVAWRLAAPHGAATHEALPVEQPAYRRGMRRAPARPRQWIARRLDGVRRLDRSAARRVIDLARAALTARCREVYALTHANADEVYWADLGEGTAIAVVGVTPGMRLTLEANYGFLLLANGVPIGYGGVTALFRQANTGINVFDAYRGSEAAAIWVQALRAFHTLFGVDRFLVNPYQFGAGNSEALASGAFWFYYQLGFRPTQRATRALAAREHRIRASRPGHRTPTATLRRLADCDMELLLPGASARDGFREEWLATLGIEVTKRLAGSRGRDRGERTVLAELCRELRWNAPAAWSRTARVGLLNLGPLLAVLPGLSRWNRRDLRRLAALVRAKGSVCEAKFVHLARALPRLFAAFARVATARRAP